MQVERGSPGEKGHGARDDGPGDSAGAGAGRAACGAGRPAGGPAGAADRLEGGLRPGRGARPPAGAGAAGGNLDRAGGEGGRRGRGRRGAGPDHRPEADIPADELARVKAESEERVAKEGKPAEIAAKIVDGQVKKYFAEKVLLSQSYIMDDSKTVEQFLKETVAKLGENIVIRQFSRIELGVTE